MGTVRKIITTSLVVCCVLAIIAFICKLYWLVTLATIGVFILLIVDIFVPSKEEEFWDEVNDVLQQEVVNQIERNKKECCNESMTFYKDGNEKYHWWCKQCGEIVDLA